MFIRFCTIAFVLALAAGCATAPEMPRAAAVAPVAPLAAMPVPEELTQALVEPVAPVVAAPAITATVTPPTPVPAPKPSIVAAPLPKAAPAAQARPATPMVKPPAPPAPTTNIIKGRLDLLAGPRQSVAADEITEGLIYFLPEDGAPAPRPGRLTISTHSKGFTPNHLVATVGSTVSFPNRDTILHNVYSRTPGSSFDLGTYGPGATRQTVLKKAGLVIVNCNVHPAMRANVVVLATPYYTRPGRDGSFQLKDLPDGPGTLVFWHPRANAGTLPIKAGRSAPVVQRLVATKARLQAHSDAGN